jgi:hypothetical protein
MKIVVSKQSIEKAMLTKVNAAINVAKDCAKRGITSFNIAVPEGAGYTQYDFINEVEHLTEHTVYAGHRAVSGESIKFSIAEEDRIYG